MEKTTPQTALEKLEDLSSTTSKPDNTSTVSKNTSSRTVSNHWKKPENTGGKGEVHVGHGKTVLDPTPVASLKNSLARLDQLLQGQESFEAEPAMMMNEIPRQLHHLKYKTYANAEPYYNHAETKT